MAQPAGARKTTTSWTPAPTPSSGSGYQTMNVPGVGIVPSSWYMQGLVKPIATKQTTTSRTDGRSWRADAGAYMNDTEYAQWLTSKNYTVQGGGEAGGYTPTAYPSPNIDLPIPDYTWSPTAEQQAGWRTVADARMALKYDPQRQEVINALIKYKQDTDLAKEQAGTSNVAQQLELANTVKNTARQPIIESAVRRGAETSGWLPEALSGLGQYETTQRTGMTKNYNDTIAELVRGVLNQETGAGTQLTALAGLQGQDLISTLDTLEDTDRTRKMEELSKTFDAQYNKASLINQIAAEQKKAEQQDALIAAQMAQSAFENQMSEKNYALDQANSTYAKTYGSGGTSNAGKLKIITKDGQVYYGTLNDWLNNEESKKAPATSLTLAQQLAELDKYFSGK